MGKNYYLNDRDILDQALEHSWGKTADAKAKEKAYNREYYQRHKEEILRKARQANEGIQREARGIKEAITGTSRRYPSNKELHSNYPDTRTTYGYGPDRYGKDAYKSNLSNRRRLEEAKSDYDRYRNTPGASQTKERVRKAASKHSSTAAAINEREKAYRQVGPESKFDSKLVRDAQNAYSKARGTARKAKDAVDRYVDDARRITKDARAGIDNAYNQARSGIENAYNQASRTAKNVKNDLETSKRTRQMKNLDTMLKAVNKLPADKYEETRELTRKMRSANAQAYNQASKSRRKKRS